MILNSTQPHFILHVDSCKQQLERTFKLVRKFTVKSADMMFRSFTKVTAVDINLNELFSVIVIFCLWQ